jgi:hypothetical protein
MGILDIDTDALVACKYTDRSSIQFIIMLRLQVGLLEGI